MSLDGEVKSADMAGIPGRLAALGPKFDPEILAATRALYTPHVPAALRGLHTTENIAYGTDARQKLDLYSPAESTDRVMVYIPGGGFVAGDKNADGVFYANIGRYFAGHGIATVVANYRLAPQAKWPAGSEDVASAVRWAKQNAAGRPAGRVFLFGQSAGAAHAASYLFDSRFHPAEGAGVDAAILMSGLYRLARELVPPASLYYGEDAESYATRAPMSHVNRSSVPLFLSNAEYDPGFLSAPTYDLAQQVTLRDGRSPRFRFFTGHNHISTVMSIGTEQDDVGAAVRDFINCFG